MNKSFLLGLFILIFLCNSCAPKEPVKLQGTVFGTTYSIIYFDDETDYQKQIDSLFTKMNKSLSTYVPTSDISRINKGEIGVKIDTYFKEVFNKSNQIYRETDGYFDPTVGSLVNAWGFGPEKPINNLDSTRVEELMQNVGFDKVHIENSQIVKLHPEIYFDFNAIAKGYGIDVIGRFLESKNIENYLVEIGGEIRSRGTKQEGKAWKVQLENPNIDGSRSAYDIVEISNQSMATSGNYRKFRIDDHGNKFVHTVNPKTGFASESNLLSATVIASLDCANVDAYATAFMSMGLEKSKAFIAKHSELKVILIYANDKGELEAFRN